MRKFARTSSLIPILLLSLATAGNSPGQAQEYQGCFLIDLDGVLVDLRELCPAAQQTSTGSSDNADDAALGTGDIQVTLRWATTDDLDLSVTDPGGEIVSFFTPTIGSGGQLDVDANAGCLEQDSTPIENIFWPPAQAPQGNYVVTVNLFQACTAAEPVPFTLTLLVQGNTQTLTGTVSEQNPVATFPFSLP